MGEFDLSLFVGQQKGSGSLKHPKPSALESRCVFAGSNTFTASFNPDHSDRFILQKGVEKANRVAASADTGYEEIGQSFFTFQDLATAFDSNYPLKIPHHHWVGMGPQRR